MMGFSCVGVTTADNGEAIAKLGKIAGKRIKVVTAFGLSVVLVPQSLSASLPNLSRKGLIKRLEQSQKTLEGLLAFQPFVATTGETHLSSEADALGVVVSHKALFENALSEFGRKVQFQVTARWDAKSVLADHFQGDETAIKAALDGDKNFGSFIEREMEKMRQHKRADFHARLTAVGDDTLLLPADEDDVILNAAVMIDRTAEPALDKAVEAIDAMMPDRLMIRYVGPLPSLSFGSIKLSQPTADAIAEARAVFDVEADLDVASVRARYHDLMRVHHPDVADAGDDDDTAQSINAAYRLLTKVSELGDRDVKTSRPILAELASDEMRRAA